MLTAAGHSPLCENQREEVEMEDTGEAGAGTRATCHVPAEWGTRVTGAGAARGQFVTNNTKYRQVHPLPSWGNVDVFVCFEILLLEGKEAKLLNIQSFSNSNVLIFMLTYCRDSYAVTYQALSISVFRIFVDMVDRDTNATWMWMSM